MIKISTVQSIPVEIEISLISFIGNDWQKSRFEQPNNADRPLVVQRLQR